MRTSEETNEQTGEETNEETHEEKSAEKSEEKNDWRRSDGVLLVRSEMALSRFARESAAFVGFVCLRTCVFVFVIACSCAKA